MHQSALNTIPQQLSLSDEYFPGSTPCILLAEPDHDVRRLLKYSLNKCGYSVIECAHGMELMIHLGTLAAASKPERVDLIISDIHIPGINGIEVFERIKHEGEFPPFILISASRDKAQRKKTGRFKALSIFDNPYDVDDLLMKVMKLLPPESHGATT
jgi:two-component system, NtrC family, response regulator AtoC